MDEKSIIELHNDQIKAYYDNFTISKSLDFIPLDKYGL